MLAIEDVLRTRAFDEVILSTLPPGFSRWIRLDLPHRVAHRFGLPVIYVISPLDHASGGATEFSADRAGYQVLTS